MSTSAPGPSSPETDESTRDDEKKMAASIERDSVYDPLGINEQYRQNRDKADKEGFVIPDDPAYRFSDNDTSGADESREGLRRLFDLVLDGDPPFEKIFVKDQTRFGRWNDPRMHIYFEMLLEQNGVEVRYCDEDNTGPPLSEGLTPENFGIAMKRVFNAIYASEERTKMIKRITVGMRDKVKEGFYPSGNAPYCTQRWLVDEATGEYVEPVPEGKQIRRAGCRYGLRWTKDGSLEVIRKIFRWLADGESMRGVARRLNEEGYATSSGKGKWHGKQVRELATNPIYKGDLVWGRTTRDGDPVPHLEAESDGDAPILYRDFMPDPPVSRDLFEEVQQRIEERPAHGRPAHRVYPLSATLTCSHCDAVWYGYTSTSQEENRRGYYRHRQDGTDDCPHQYRYIRSSVIEEAVWNHLVARLNHAELDKLVLRELEKLEGRSRQEVRADRIDTLRGSLEEAQVRLERVVEELVEAEAGVERESLREYRSKVASRVERMKADLAELEEETKAVLSARSRVTEITELLTDKVDLIQNAEPGRAKQLIKELVDRVEFDIETGKAILFTRPL